MLDFWGIKLGELNCDICNRMLEINKDGTSLICPSEDCYNNEWLSFL